MFDGVTGELEHTNFAGSKFFRHNVFHDVRHHVRRLVGKTELFVSEEVQVQLPPRLGVCESVSVLITYLPHVAGEGAGWFMARAGTPPPSSEIYSRAERLWELLLVGGLDRAQHTGAVIELGLAELGLQAGSLSRVEDQVVVNECVVGDSHLSKGSSLVRSHTLADRIVRAQKTIASDDTALEPDFAGLDAPTEGGIRRFVSVPFSAADRQWVLTLSSSQPRALPFNQSERQYAELMARVLARLLSRHEDTERLEYLAYFDPLTALPNRSATLARLDETLSTAARGARRAGLMFLDIDGFKGVNDTLGHSAGDSVLIEISSRFRSALRKGEYVGRVGGDEFAILFPEFTADHQIQEAAHRIAAVLARPFELRNHSFQLAASIGIAVFPTDGATAEQLLTSADAAMYRAKHGGGKSICWYSAGLHDELEKKRELSENLRSASMDKEFLLCYQPVEDPNGKLIGAEALLRWLHPSKGLLSPSTFMEMATQTKLVSLIDAWVLGEVLAQSQRWHRIGYSPRLYINLSSLDKSLLNQLDALAERERFDQSCVSLEVSEGLIMRDFPSSEQFLDGCHVRGLRVGIDRFGSGTSSLKQLASLPINFIKLDHALVGCLFRDARAAAILDANIQIGKAFGWTMIAEGVETPEQRDWLVAKGVEGLQGYDVGYPMTTVDFESRLRVDGMWNGQTASA